MVFVVRPCVIIVLFDVFWMVGVAVAKSIAKLSLENTARSMTCNVQKVKQNSLIVSLLQNLDSRFTGNAVNRNQNRLLFVVVFLDFSQNGGAHAIGSDFCHSI